MKRILLLLFSMVLCVVSSAYASTTSPRIVVNIIVGGMRAGDIDRYRSTFGAGGFLRLEGGGVNYTNAHYTSSQTTTPSSLTTLTTGATPAIHGVVGEVWWDRLTGERVDLLRSSKVKSLEYHTRDYSYSAERLIAPTLTEQVLGKSKSSKVVSISVEPTPSILLSAEAGKPYWIDSQSCEWSSSTAFMSQLPTWVLEYNKSPQISTLAAERWISRLQQSLYRNTVTSTFSLRKVTKRYEAPPLSRARSRAEIIAQRYKQLSTTPAGNEAIFDYAQKLIIGERLGDDEHTDVLNIYLDPARNISQMYGVESVEVEDMFCRLDADIAAFIKFLEGRIKLGDVVITLTSDHGMSPAYGQSGEPKGRFDADQFVVVVNSFLRARYGGDNWVLGYDNRNLYLSHQEIFRNKQSIADVQNEVSSFALQFRGVSHAVSATALRSGSFMSGYGYAIQNGFYARQSGDVIINFMPGWIEQKGDNKADAGSTYRYDSCVPLIIYGEGYSIGHTVEREVEMVDFAPTIAYILGVDSPAASEGRALSEIVESFKR